MKKNLELNCLSVVPWGLRKEQIPEAFRLSGHVVGGVRKDKVLPPGAAKSATTRVTFVSRPFYTMQKKPEKIGYE